MAARTFELSDDEEAFVESQIRSGQFRDANEVIRAGLAALADTPTIYGWQRDDLLAEAKIGFDELDAGLGITFEDSKSLEAWLQGKVEQVILQKSSAPSAQS